MTTDQSRPFDFLSDSIGKTVLIELKGERKIRGKIKAFDVHMNLILHQADLLENNEVKKKYGKIVLRGDNVILVSL